MMSRLSALREFLGNVDGAAAAEFVLSLPVLIIPLMGLIDLGSFTVQRMQVDAASQSGASAAWHACTDDTKPANQTNCTGGNLSSEITAAVQATTLGTRATLGSTPVVGYYCANGSTTKPEQYIQVAVNSTYTPMFGLLSSVLPTTITRTSWRRLA